MRRHAWSQILPVAVKDIRPDVIMPELKNKSQTRQKNVIITDQKLAWNAAPESH